MQSITTRAPSSVGPEHPRWTETLRNHVSVLIRPIRRTDADAERAFIESMSAESRRYRFLGQVGHPSDALIEQLTTLDYQQDVAFAATVPEGAHERFLGVARYATTADRRSCECAVAVLDDWHHQGLGTKLMQHLIDVARAQGIDTMYSIDSAENLAMADLAKHFGFERRVDPGDPCQVIHTLRLTPMPTTR